MPSVQAKIAIWSNNSYLKSHIEEVKFDNLSFSDYTNSCSCPFVLVLIDLSQDLNNISQKIINIYEHCSIKGKKLCLALFQWDTIDTEKNLYFSQLLQQLGSASPIHRLVYVKDIISENLISPETWLEKYILESLLEGKIHISSKGENKIYPLTVKDFLAGLQKTFFLSGTAGKEFWMVGDPLTDLDLAYLLKKYLEDTNESFEIEATEANRSNIDLNSLGNSTRALLNWEPKDDFSWILKNSAHRIGEDRTQMAIGLRRLETQTKQPRLYKLLKIKNYLIQIVSHIKRKKIKTKEVESTKGLIKRTSEIVFACLAFIYLFFTAVYIIVTALALVNLEESLNLIRSGEIKQSVKYLSTSQFYSKTGEFSYDLISPVFSFLAPDFQEKNHNMFVFLTYSQSSVQNLQQTYLLAENIYQSIGVKESGLNIHDAALALRSNLSQVYENINQIRLLTQGRKLPKVLDEKLSQSAEYKNISLVEQQITQLLKATELIPAFLAGDEIKNILLVFQNSSEIRGTGGVVDYLLALVLDKGRLVSRNIYTGSEIDSLIHADITAPPLINQLTGSESWLTRDLNYNPDFPSTAENFSAVIEKSLKFKPDTIVAVNENIISDLLIADKGIVINGQNITSDEFQRQLPLTSPNLLYRQLIDYYLDRFFNHNISLLSLGRVIAKQTIENQLLFWSHEENIENMIIEQSLSGAIIPHICSSSLSELNDCVAESTYLNESNFSLVPVGHNLRRRIAHKISFTPKSTVHEYTVDYKFIKPFENLNRDLMEVIQIYAPEDSKLGPVTVNGEPISPSSVLQQKDHLLERFQIPISLKFNVDNQLLISFTAPLKQNLIVPFSYSITEYHQPGLIPGGENTELTIVLPENTRASLLTAPAESSPEGYKYVFPSKTSSFGIRMVPVEQ